MRKKNSRKVFRKSARSAAKSDVIGLTSEGSDPQNPQEDLFFVKNNITYFRFGERRDCSLVYVVNRHDPIPVKETPEQIRKKV